MQAPVPLRVCKGLVTGVDDGPGARGSPGHFLRDVLRPLTEAEPGPADRLQHLAGPGEYLAGHEEGDEPRGEAFERDVPARQIVLVTAVGVPNRIRVVLEGEDGSTEILLPKQAAGAEEEVRDDALASLVVGHQIDDLVGLRGRVLRVKPGVEIQAASVLEEHIPAPRTGHDPLEDMADDVLPRRKSTIVHTAEEAVLGLKPEDTTHECPSLGWACRPATA